MTFELDRFVAAQAPIYEDVLEELRRGRKRTHWMWFIFPQLVGLGRSATAVHFGIVNLEEARAYLAHPVLGARLRECAGLMLEHQDRSAHDILGSPDDLKFRSCLTLFREAAADDAGRGLFDAALQQFYSGAPDSITLELLKVD
jgi:uncharacterized protein (DUF1810 family)